MKMLTFTPESQGAEVVASEIPGRPARRGRALSRTNCSRSFRCTSNELAELMLWRSRRSPVGLVRKVIRDATVHRLIVPVLCGSALDFIGIQPLLDAVMYYLPSPADVPPVEGADPKERR